ncbi:unnamed protein product [Spirodela intermedia]|uniref:Uncharacterized protein n=2 Tax=Spirodela intermedia TaxID=51605 RepID=A0A7I8K754_SPIIN|nr:unnamed protein product [Spirodela intermedia]CAA6656947.1 unnamed protein product [Spirodela intermedia]CAA7392922.1 unnamed protein product [Spirodela intermedia]
MTIVHRPVAALPSFSQAPPPLGKPNRPPHKKLFTGNLIKLNI